MMIKMVFLIFFDFESFWKFLLRKIFGDWDKIEIKIWVKKEINSWLLCYLKIIDGWLGELTFEEFSFGIYNICTFHFDLIAKVHLFFWKISWFDLDIGDEFIWERKIKRRKKMINFLSIFSLFKLNSLLGRFLI